MTLSKIAKEANVSVSTVSKVFSGSKEISEQTREKVIKIAKDNGCYTKYCKEKYPKKVIAVICSELKSAYYSAYITHLEQIISNANATLVVSFDNFDSKKQAELIDYYASYGHADGILVLELSCKAKIKTETPIVAIGDSATKGRDCAYTDLESAIQDAITYFKECGHSKIAFIGESLTKSKQELYVKAMNSHGLFVNSDAVVVSKSRFEDAGYEGMEQLFKQKVRPTAILAAYDNMALGAMQCIRDHGYCVPEDFSIIGMDDISVISYLDVPLTSIRTNMKEACTLAFELLLKKMNSKYYLPRQQMIVQSELIKRKSVRDIKTH